MWPTAIKWIAESRDAPIFKFWADANIINNYLANADVFSFFVIYGNITEVFQLLNSNQIKKKNFQEPS